jgi:cation diffusion facilitator CzcD-associated flavoprotein CzcO
MPADASTPSPRWCVIGAGPSGLTSLKNLRAAGIAAECLEREAELGGNWAFGTESSRVFASTRLISSKTLTAFTDFPMPREWPAYPDHRQCLEYLHHYADHFGLKQHIVFKATVTAILPVMDATGRRQGWTVTLADGSCRHYAGIVLASGHNHVPRWPEVPGEFTGTLLHAADYKSPTVPVNLAGKRVLVIGGGNSGCDIAVDVSRQATVTLHSTRRAYHVVPRMVLGRPADLRGERLLKMGAPLWLRRLVSQRAIARTIGLPPTHGLPTPDHRLWETHPVINDCLYAQIDAGSLTPVPDLVRLTGNRVEFADGRCEEIDVIIAATGYQLTFPGIDAGLLNSREGLPRLFLHLLHPAFTDLAVVGMIQPDSGQWGITDLQAQVVTRMILAERFAPRAGSWLARQKQRKLPPPSIRYLDSPRHALEVEHFGYSRELKRLIRGLDRRLRQAADRFPEQTASSGGSTATR